MSSNNNSNWRKEVKSLFSGRGNQWIYVSLDSINPTLEKLDVNGFDTKQYREFISVQGKAWVRFSGPRIINGNNVGAFEVRLDGSRIDSPKCLHYIQIEDLTIAKIERLENTPFRLGIEGNKTSAPKKEKAVKSKVLKKKSKLDELADSLNDNVEVKTPEFNPPTSSNPDEWEEFLKSQGLAIDDDEDILDIFDSEL